MAAPRKRPLQGETADKILDVAEQLVQARGFNGFSYADIAGKIGVTKASLHYHFPSKADLGRRLIERYHQRFMDRLQSIDQEASDIPDKLRRYAEVYLDVFRTGRMCLCGMLAADFATLPKPMQAGVRHFFEANKQWLAAMLGQGRSAKTLTFSGDPADRAWLLVSSLEGAMLVARPRGDVAGFDQTVRRLIADLRPSATRLASS